MAITHAYKKVRKIYHTLTKKHKNGKKISSKLTQYLPATNFWQMPGITAAPQVLCFPCCVQICDKDSKYSSKKEKIKLITTMTAMTIVMMIVTVTGMIII